MKLLGLQPTAEGAENVAKGLKGLRCGDLFELDLSEELENEATRVDEALIRSEDKVSGRKSDTG